MTVLQGVQKIFVSLYRKWQYRKLQCLKKTMVTVLYKFLFYFLTSNISVRNKIGLIVLLLLLFLRRKENKSFFSYFFKKKTVAFLKRQNITAKNIQNDLSMFCLVIKLFHVHIFVVIQQFIQLVFISSSCLMMGWFSQDFGIRSRINMNLT